MIGVVAQPLQGVVGGRAVAGLAVVLGGTKSRETVIELKSPRYTVSSRLPTPVSALLTPVLLKDSAKEML